MDETKEQQTIGQEEQSAQQQELNGEILETQEEMQVVASEAQSPQQQALSEEALEAVAGGGWASHLLDLYERGSVLNKAYTFEKKYL